jgi:hypothetical protein
MALEPIGGGGFGGRHLFVPPGDLGGLWCVQ